MKIKIADLDLTLQTRAGTDVDTINNYAEAMADGAAFPDVTVFTDGRHYWLADGFHRVMAAKQNGKAQISADVRKGTEDDAVVFGGTANNKQGKRPTRADVQHFLSMVWERREAIFGGTPTGGNLAEKCGITRQAATKFVNEKLAAMPKAPTRPTVNNLQLPKRGTADSSVHNAQLKAPVRPTQLIGANGKMYPVRPVARPSMPTRPEKPAHVVPVDRYGVEIPVEMQEAFEPSPLADILSCISKARVALRKGFEEKDPAFAAVRQDALVNLNNAYNFVNAAEPHCVCRMCQGTGCKACHERGWQTEEEYNRNPKEFQAKGGAK
ncbi:MAG: hypothetical protein J6V72_11180 [Kiritimatiellae bacterium]|nr:hypothetical protein [Kiritimatiellia bacterium]